LALAGYPNGKGLPAVTLSYTPNDAGQKAAAPVLQRMWSQYLGVNVSLNPTEQAAYNNALTARNYQIANISWGADYPDPQNFLSLQLQTGNGNNNGSFSDPTFDRLTKEADTLVGNNAQRFRLYHQAEEIALNKAAWLVLYWGKSAMMIDPKVQGLVINGGGLTAANWADVTIK
jgi:ABC-type oligopeptide transport system substrate-binding subunit